MELNQEHIDELIAKVLSGEAGQHESARVEEWAASNPANRLYFDQFKAIFSQTGEMKAVQQFDTDAAWLKLRGQLHAGDAKVVQMSGWRSPAFYWRVAAAVLVIAVAGVYFLRQNTGTLAAPVVVTAHSDTVADTLPDGTHVFLNKASTMTYMLDKKSRMRRVQLKGEAYFDMGRKQAEDFVIDIDGVYIRDIGTSFNVKAPEGANTIEVTVDAGEVMFYTANDSGLYLKAGARGVYDKLKKTFSLEQPDVNVLSYKTRVFAFNSLDLATVVSQLNAVYPRHIEVSPAVAHCRLTVDFNNESQDEIIAVIAETLGLRILESNGKYYLEGAGCEP